MTHLLILGGTTEAGELAQTIAGTGIRATYSYAGRVGTPRPQPVPTRSGGFGGVAGLVRYLRDAQVTHVVDATHPFAARMSRNAHAACAETGVPLVALTRPPWTEGSGDRWTHVPDIDAAVAALSGPVRRVFLAVGRVHLDAFAAQPQHHYLLRLVDDPDAPPLPDCTVIVDRGPFDLAQDTALLRAHRIDLVVSKNSGGSGARSKIDAARALDLPVLIIDRPELPERTELHEPERILDWLAHSGVNLGV
ncbi:precorrin-6A reductase [Cribrihabitans marinus]|uniref:Precorrin-6A reductase n=1 Tax=Cribrihabitans marinus TaxID=1227549 RepID=A0A1H7B4G0_9RHOB|nr:cobalt-precorrin-6A reductase [Cribrihabitans marinus]GGH32915.1 precorrin-6A reductase [Cribrihabitans marinus]SEJ71137.1 precorrin-6A reductase [Cribrihabitans marinus]